MIMLYTVTAMGFALNVHYCGNIMLSVQVNAPAKSCMMNKMPVKMKCCKDKHIDVKVKDSHQVAESSSFLAKIFSIILPAFPLKDFFFSATGSFIEQPADRGPPDDQVAKDVPAFLKNRNLRI